MKIESRVGMIAATEAACLDAAVSCNCSPTIRVRQRKISGLVPASTGRRYSSQRGFRCCRGCGPLPGRETTQTHDRLVTCANSSET
jgi:hypothetical protein